MSDKYHYIESHARSIIKALSWRAGGLIVTVAVAYAITRSAGLAATVGLADTFVKIGVFYVHERIWLKVKFGRKVQADYEI